ncbi:hypothetical protein Y032_0188g1167 [Ancylostoma ceylanicum]|uniref:Uncharacterized protein n=1 Tax=Ancylostoma ceylanicum TaxID=53326 RepID=A0A016SRM9_9BILA|nr:hypothetical protein Y032_0188g1167 [Ancylostoma ceylanicum]
MSISRSLEKKVRSELGGTKLRSGNRRNKWESEIIEVWQARNSSSHSESGIGISSEIEANLEMWQKYDKSGEAT